MNDKVNVKVIIPQINMTFDMFLPVNQKIGVIIKRLNKGIYELSNGNFPINENTMLFNGESMQLYNHDVILLNTDIRNSTKLILIQ